MNAYTASPVLLSDATITAHSGPELVDAVPESALAGELAEALIASQLQLVESYQMFSGLTPSVQVRLGRTR